MWVSLGLISFAGLFGIKRMVYDQMLPDVVAKEMFRSGKFSHVVMSSFMMICYFKNP
jgi:hypothetical protein